LFLEINIMREGTLPTKKILIFEKMSFASVMNVRKDIILNIVEKKMKNKRFRRGLELTVERENCIQSNFPTGRGDLWIFDGLIPQSCSLPWATKSIQGAK